MRPTRTAEQTAALVAAYHAAHEVMRAATRQWAASGRPMSPFATIRTCPVLAACRAAMLSAEALVDFDYIVYEGDRVLFRLEDEAEAGKIVRALWKSGRKTTGVRRWLAGEPWGERSPDWHTVARRVAGVA